MENSRLSPLPHEAHAEERLDGVPVGVLVGVPVLVRSSFEGRWCPGFTVAEVVRPPNDGPRCRVQRRSDGTVLPVWFTSDDVVVDRERQSR